MQSCLNNASGSPFSLSATTPVVIPIGVAEPSKMFLTINEVNTIISNKGLILEGPKEFYASFRMRHISHSETLISKGRPGIGTAFRLGCLINETTDPRKSFVASVMATEDNTTMTLSDYDQGVVFATNSGNLSISSQTFVLNAGQSVIFSGYSSDGTNTDGIIGALVSSDKPVAVSTGNALGGIEANRADFSLDQIVSASQIGTEYIFIEGNGLPSMENPLIVAHENNTEIYVNGSASPVTTINAGDYYLVNNSAYQGTTNRNIFVKTSKPVFAYQLLGGGNDTATAGLNFIPPLSCFFQNSVNIPAVNQIGNDIYTSDLMILTYPNATLTVNGNTIPATQAQAVLGNSEWVTYRTPSVTGNTNVISTGPLAVGVFGFLGTASGYAGYYSGFGSNPEDTDVTVCSNQPIDLLDAIIGNPRANGTWVIPSGGIPLNGNIFNPAVNIPGEYIYNMPDCNNPLISIPVKVNVDIQQAGNAGINNSVVVCTNDPSFDLFPILGSGTTIGGTWSPALNSGTGTFDPAVDISGVYTYTIPTIGACARVSATITVTNNLAPAITTISDFVKCDDNLFGTDYDGVSFFDLTTKNGEILNSQNGIIVTYHLLPNDAISGLNAITSINSASRIIYTRLTNTTTNCYNVTSFNLVVNPLPIVSSVVPFKQCDTDTDAITTFNLTEANINISSQPNLTFTYYTSLANAISETSPISNPTQYVSGNNGRVWSRIVNEYDCFRISEINLIVSTTIINLTNPYTIEECDDYIDANDPNADGFDYFNLSTIDNLITQPFPAGQSYTVTYYETESDALQEINAIANVTNYRNITAFDQIVWVRIDSNLNNDCVGLGPYLQLIVNPLPIIDLGENFTLCLDPVTGIGLKTVDATPTIAGNYSYTWTPANPNGNSPLYDIVAAGTYSVVVTNTTTNYSETDNIIATFSSEPQSVYATLITPAFSIGLASIEVTTIGGFGIYEYSLDAIDWQSSPIFNNLPNGSYSIFVRDIQGCGLLKTEIIQTITYNNYFTPNQDGYNDTWNIYLPDSYEGIISIYDRYGKFIKQISPYGDGWDGTYLGNLLPSTDYWFKVEYTEDNTRKEFKTHFSLKR